MADVLHLAKRFFGALSQRPPEAEDERWALDQLIEAEVGVWSQMSNPDRRHAIEVARLVDTALATSTSTSAGVERRTVLAAALLHDSGKVLSDFGTYARVGATLVWATLDDDVARRWSSGSGLRRRLADYRLHPELGADRLAAGNSDAFVVAWAREHHLAPSSWTTDAALGSILKRCDDD